ncbi:MAG TPA: MbcA/ParS/Xre antitoxin family protein [Geminicoccaceae bacterium]|nr:MbcA/ParS/Xre antitoxin family protein [Geminicoccus sp.]HMU51433.1 MbcA/ParS/Xre antitoxin family protein [Geminicoccaceae bacterium]
MAMQAAGPVIGAAGPADMVVDPALADPATRRRLSGPALRTFLGLADRWQLGEAQRLRILGQPGRSTYYAWLDKARRREAVTLPLDTLLRLSALFGIQKGLGILFARGGDALAWLSAPNAGPVFGGQRPLDLVISGTQDGLMLVRRHLDAWRGGNFSAPSPNAGPPLRDDDIVIVDDRRPTA